MVFAEPGPRLGRERLRNGRIQCEPMRDENPCAARISTVSSTWHEPLMLTTDQEVGVRVPPGVLLRPLLWRGLSDVRACSTF